MYDFKRKSMKFITKITPFIALLFFVSACQQEDIFEIPKSLGLEENTSLATLISNIESGGKNLVSIAYAKDLMVSGEATEITSDIVIKGYVVSSDSTGNFYKEFYIQDNPIAPTAAIRLLIDITDSYNMFNIGREVYVDLKGLYIGEYRTGDGVITIGELDIANNRITNVKEKAIKTHILRAATTSEIEPLSVKFSQINDSHVGIMVQVIDVNVASSDLGEPYVDPNDSFDTQRTLEACDGFSKKTFLLETSAFADFKQDVLPSGTGTIKAVVTKTYNGDNLVLMLNSTEDVDFNGEPCELLNISDFDTVLDEQFDNVVDNSIFDYTGWVNYAEVGGEFWTEQLFSGNGYVEFSGYRTGDDVNIGWLITPVFDLTGATDAYINFKLAQHHLDDEDNNTLEVFVSTDFDGTNVTAATWEKQNVVVPGEDISWYAFQDVGLIDVSTYSGNLYVAFKYIGSGTDTSLDGGYFVDDLMFLKK
jgi:hypothetical protein